MPEFDLLPSKRGKEGEGKAKKGRARRAKAPAKTLLPEDHHYDVRTLLCCSFAGCCWRDGLICSVGRCCIEGAALEGLALANRTTAAA